MLNLAWRENVLKIFRKGVEGVWCGKIGVGKMKSFQSWERGAGGE